MDKNTVTIELGEKAAEKIEALAAKAAEAIEESKGLNVETKKIHEEIRTSGTAWQSSIKAMQETLKKGTFDQDYLKSEIAKVFDREAAERAGRGIVDPASIRAMNALTDPFDQKGDYLTWRFKRHEGSSLDILQNAILSRPRTDLQKYFQRQAIDMGILMMLADRASKNPPIETIKHRMPRVWQKWQDYKVEMLAEITGKATVEPIDTTDTANWVPAPMASELRALIMIESRVPQLFETVIYDGPGKTWDLPVDLTDVLPDLITETTAYTNPYAATDPTQLGQTVNDAKRTFTFAKHRVRFILSGEFDEDSIVPAIPLLRGKFVRTMANGHEKVIIDGQKTANIDTGGGGPGTYDIRKASDGIRYFCSAGVANVLYNTGADNLAYGDLIAARALMGEYGMMPADLALIVGPSGFMQILKIAEVVTADKFGDRATIFTGAVAALGGVAVVPSRYVREDLNASGIYDAVTTTRTVAIVVNRRTFLTVEKRAITIEQARLAPTDQTDLIAMRRLDYNQVQGTTQKSAAVIFNINTAIV